MNEGNKLASICCIIVAVIYVVLCVLIATQNAIDSFATMSAGLLALCAVVFLTTGISVAIYKEKSGLG